MAQLSDTAGETIVVAGATTDSSANDVYTWVSTGLYTGTGGTPYDIFIDDVNDPTSVVIRDDGDSTVYTADNVSQPLGSYSPADAGMTLTRYPAAPTVLSIPGDTDTPTAPTPISV